MYKDALNTISDLLSSATLQLTDEECNLANQCINQLKGLVSHSEIIDLSGFPKRPTLRVGDILDINVYSYIRYLEMQAVLNKVLNNINELSKGVSNG